MPLVAALLLLVMCLAMVAAWVIGAWLLDDFTKDKDEP